MMRICKTLTRLSFVVAALAAAPALAQGEPANKNKTPAVDLSSVVEALRPEFQNLEKNLSKQIKDVSDDLQGLKTTVLDQRLEIDRQKKEIARLAEEVASLQKKLLAQDKSAAPGSEKAMEEMRASLKAIQESIAKLGESSARISKYLPTETGAATAGRVVLVNLYSEDLVFVINNVTHRVPPGMTKMIDNVPLGTLNYAVLSDTWGRVQDRITTLTPNQPTFTLAAQRPR